MRISESKPPGFRAPTESELAQADAFAEAFGKVTAPAKYGTIAVNVLAAVCVRFMPSFIPPSGVAALLQAGGGKLVKTEGRNNGRHLVGFRLLPEFDNRPERNRS